VSHSRHENVPHHVAIIMDGNGRWAKARGLPRIEGHRRGGDSVRDVLKGCEELGIDYLTLFAFSAENWRRPADEVGALMQLLVRFLRRETAELVKRKIRLHAIGHWQDLPAATRRELEHALAATAHFRKRHLTLALSYGSRQEAAAAARAYAEAVQRGEENPAECSWEKFSRYLFTAELPDPDLIIRTSGESRLSNFLMLQGAYSELYFSPVPWPEFRKEHLAEAVACFQQRERRYGRTGEQLRAPPTERTVATVNGAAS
jgi:undecaprenyl diphosphate synthase